MNAQDLLSLGKMMQVRRVPDGKITVSYQRCEVKDGHFLRGTYGIGETFQEACEDYFSQLHGKTLVFNAYTSSREEIRVL